MAEVAEKLRDKLRLYGATILVHVRRVEFKVEDFKDFETGILIKNCDGEEAKMLGEFFNHVTRVDGNEVAASVKISKLRELTVALADDGKNLMVDAKRNGELHQYVLSLPLKAKPPVRMRYTGEVLEVRVKKT